MGFELLDLAAFDRDFVKMHGTMMHFGSCRFKKIFLKSVIDMKIEVLTDSWVE